ncbi:MAG: DUF4157 domain-containing protein [Anaerolineales bacterium]
MNKTAKPRQAAPARSIGRAAPAKAGFANPLTASSLLQRATARPDLLGEKDALALQRLGGNRAAGRFLAPAGTRQRVVQTKLAVGPAGDSYEQQADRVADQVLRMPAPEGAEEQPAAITPLAQRAMPEEDDTLQTQRQDPRAGFEAGPAVEDRLGAQKGAGQPLPGEVRGFMEPRFGADFSQVRVHTGGEASRLSRQLSAQAFTHGTDIYMAEGKYSPASGDGRRLLAHELTHVVQQTGAAAPGVARQPALVQRKIGFEFELDHWNTWQADPATEFDEQTALNTRQNQTREEYREARRKDVASQEKWKRLPKGDILVESGDVELTADDQANKSDLELRTKALPETDLPRATAAAGAIKTRLDELGTELRSADRGFHQLRSRDLSGTLGNAASFLTGANPENQRGKPQATVGIRLEALPDLIRNLFPDPAEGATDRGRRAEGREMGTGFKQDTQTAGPILQIMGAAPGKAAAAIAAFLPKHGNAPSPASPKLAGLVALLIAYLDMGQSGLVRSYAKTIAPVMARTDFATMFAMLPDNERDYYAGDNGGKFVDLLKGAGYNWFAMRGSIYSGGIRESSEPNAWYKDLTRKDWLKSMTAPSTGAGTDKLTPASFPTQRGKDEIEGLGSYANRIDKVVVGSTTIDVPIVELRSLPTMDATTFADFAVKLTRLVGFMNQLQDKTFGEL